MQQHLSKCSLQNTNLTKWFIIKGLHSETNMENLKNANICHSWRVTINLSVLNAPRITAMLTYFILLPCFLLFSQERVSAERSAHLTWQREIARNSPSSRTTRGTFSSSSRQALVIPLAMMAQLTIPPKILTRMASTWNQNQKDAHQNAVGQHSQK